MRNDITIHPHERVDDLHRDGHLIIQDPKRFCFGVDAVILSGFAKVKKGENVLDLGTGTGIIPILLAAKTEGSISPVWKSRRRVRKWQTAVCF